MIFYPDIDFSSPPGSPEMIKHLQKNENIIFFEDKKVYIMWTKTDFHFGEEKI
jgi:hypothetical protein